MFVTYTFNIHRYMRYKNLHIVFKLFGQKTSVN